MNKTAPTLASISPAAPSEKTIAERLQAAEFDMRLKVLNARGQPMPFEEQVGVPDEKKPGTLKMEFQFIEATLGFLIHTVLTRRTQGETIASDDAMKFAYIARKCSDAQLDPDGNGMVRLSTDQVDLILKRVDLTPLPIEAIAFMKQILNPVAWQRMMETQGIEVKSHG